MTAMQHLALFARTERWIKKELHTLLTKKRTRKVERQIDELLARAVRLQRDFRRFLEQIA